MNSVMKKERRKGREEGEREGGRPIQNIQSMLIIDSDQLIDQDLPGKHCPLEGKGLNSLGNHICCDARPERRNEGNISKTITKIETAE